MKSEEFVSTAVNSRRAVLTVLLLFGVAACSSFFILFSNGHLPAAFCSSLHAQGVQKGIASYYAKSWTGRKTASGDRLHHDSMTCAHRTYPFGTLLKVTNPNNGKEVIVRVNDRGPYVHKRIIDLSWGAAKALGMLSQGIGTVIVQPANLVFLTLAEHEKIEIPKFYESMEEEEDFPLQILIEPSWLSVPQNGGFAK